LFIWQIAITITGNYRGVKRKEIHRGPSLLTAGIKISAPFGYVYSFNRTTSLTAPAKSALFKLLF